MRSEDLEEEQTDSSSLSLVSPLVLDAEARGFFMVMTTLGLVRGGECCRERVDGRGVEREVVSLERAIEGKIEMEKKKTI